MIKKYRKKPVVIEAIRWNGKNEVDVYRFLSGDTTFRGFVPMEGANFRVQNGQLFIKTLEGDVHASRGDMIIKGVNGEFYPCKPDIFDKTYEFVEGE